MKNPPDSSVEFTNIIKANTIPSNFANQILSDVAVKNPLTDPSSTNDISKTNSNVSTGINPPDPSFLKKRVERFYRRMENGNPVKGQIPTAQDIKLFTNDYLSLATYPDIIKIQADMLIRDGNGLMMSGVNQPAQSPQRSFEQRMANFLQAEDVVVTQSGYCANLGLLQSIADKHTTTYLDVFAHASLWEGARSAGSPIQFSHTMT